MKHFLIFTLFLFSGIHCFSQTYIDKITLKTCNSLDNISDTLETTKFNMKIGLCMIDAAMPYRKQLKHDYDIDLDKMDAQVGEKLGKLIGIKMAVVCPDGLSRITKRATKNIELDQNEKIIEGVVTKIENANFVVFSLRDDFGKIYKFHWMSFIHSDVELTANYNTLMGKTIKITYNKKDFFDPNILEYRQYNIISKIDSVIN